MNILIIPSWYSSKENPLNGIFFSEQAVALKNYFREQNINDKVYILAIERIPVTRFKKYIKNLLTVISLENEIPTMRACFLGIPKIKKIDLKIGARKLNKCLNKFKKKCGIEFDLVHIHSALDAGIWYCLSKQMIPYVITEHSSKYSRNLIHKQEKCFLPKVFNNAQEIFTVGKGLAKEVKKYTDKRVQVLFNIVNNSFVLNQHFYSKSKNFTFFSLGLNAIVKGHDILLEAFQNFILSGYNAKLIIAGLTETEKRWLLRLVKNEKVLNNLELMGRLDRKKIFELMAISDCFSLVSRFETFGIVFAEAMYCGKPVIATRTGGPDSFVTDENGILVDIENVEQTTKALIHIFENIQIYDSNKICKYAMDNFSADVICEKLYTTYNSVIKKF